MTGGPLGPAWRVIIEPLDPENPIPPIEALLAATCCDEEGGQIVGQAIVALLAAGVLVVGDPDDEPEAAITRRKP